MPMVARVRVRQPDLKSEAVRRGIIVANEICLAHF